MNAVNKIIKQQPHIIAFIRSKTTKQTRNNRIAIIVSMAVIVLCVGGYFIPEIFKRSMAGVYTDYSFLFIAPGLVLLFFLIALPGILGRSKQQRNQLSFISQEDWDQIDTEIETASTVGVCTVTSRAIVGYSKWCYTFLLDHRMVRRAVVGFWGDSNVQIIPTQTISWAYIGKLNKTLDFLVLITKQNQTFLLPLDRMITEQEGDFLLAEIVAQNPSVICGYSENIHKLYRDYLAQL